MSILISANGAEYPVHYVDGILRDARWDGRAVKEITLEMTYAQAAALFVDGLAWSIVQREEGKEDQVFDNADYCVAGSITDNRDGTVTCRMGRHTELELAQTAKAEAESALAELEAAYDNG